MTEIPQGALGVDKPQCLFSGKQVQWLQPLFPSCNWHFCFNPCSTGIQNYLYKKIVLIIWLPPETLPMESDLPGGLISHTFPPHSHHAPLPSTFTLHAFLHAVPLPGMPFPFSSMVNLASSSALEQILFSHEGKPFPSPSGKCGSNLLLFAIFINLSSLSCQLASLYFIYWSL